MRILLYGKEEYKNQFLLKNKISVVNDHPDVVITLGGDGTFLHAVHQYGLDPLYLPINCGKLGFLTSYEWEDFDYKHVNFNNICYITLPQIKYNNQEFFFLNEIRLSHLTNTTTYQLTINEETLTYYATGMELVAPLGTTGSSYANHGPIINPFKELYSIKAILGVNNKIYKTLVNPIICDYYDKVYLTINTPNSVTIDGILFGNVENISISISKAAQQLKVIDARFKKYYHLLQDKII